MNEEEIKDDFGQFILSELATELSIDVEDIDVNEDIWEYGIDSISIAMVSDSIQKRYSFQLNAKLVFQTECLDDLLEDLWNGNKDKIIDYHK